MKVARINDPHLADLSVKCSPELDQSLRILVQLENCRSYHQMVGYFLEVMLAVLNRNHRLSLVLPKALDDTRLTGQIRADVPVPLIEDISKAAPEFSTDRGELVRVLLQMALGFYQKLVPAGEIPRKEEMVRLIEADYAHRAKLERFPFWLRRLAALFIRREKR
jgi:hypothetical protein